MTLAHEKSFSLLSEDSISSYCIHVVMCSYVRRLLVTCTYRVYLYLISRRMLMRLVKSNETHLIFLNVLYSTYHRNIYYKLLVLLEDCHF